MCVCFFLFLYPFSCVPALRLFFFFRLFCESVVVLNLSLFFLSCAQRLRMEKDTASVRVELRDAKTRSLELSGDLREVKDDVARLRWRNASLETTLRETRARSEQDAVRRASLIKKSEDAERVSRLRVAYARECERRLAVAEAEKIRLTRALDARGGR